MSNGAPIIDANVQFGFWPQRNADLSLEGLSVVNKKHGVAKSLALSTTGILHDYRTGNEETLAAARQHSEIFPVATVNPREYVHCEEELAQRLQQGFPVFRLFPDVQEWPFAFAPFQAVMGRLNESGVPVMINIARLGDLTRLMESLPMHMAPIIAVGVSNDMLGEAVCVMKDNPSLHIETHLINSVDGIDVLAEQVGSERLVFGSGAPLHYLASAVMVVKMSTLTDEQKSAVFGTNIRNLLAKKSG